MRRAGLQPTSLDEFQSRNLKDHPEKPGSCDTFSLLKKPMDNSGVTRRKAA